MTTPHPDLIRAAGAALARAAIFDDRITDSDQARILAWAQAMEPFAITQPDALEAVTRHYQKPDADTIRVGDLIADAREIRRQRAEREKGSPEQLPPTPPDPQTGNLPIPTGGTPVWEAYEQHGAIGRVCPTCDAKPEESCINLATNMTRKIPCVARLKDPDRPRGPFGRTIC